MINLNHMFLDHERLWVPENITRMAPKVLPFKSSLPNVITLCEYDSCVKENSVNKVLTMIFKL